MGISSRVTMMARLSGFGSGYRATLILAIPLIVSNLSQAMKHMTDVIMLGWYGVDELAAVVLGSTVWAVLFIIGSGWAMAVITLTSRAAGEGNRQKVRRHVRMGCWLAVMYCLVTSPLMWNSGLLFSVLDQQPEIYRIAESYLRIAMWGLYPALIVMTLKSFFLATLRPGIILWSTLAGAMLNAVLNYVLIFGRLGMPEMGVVGAAIGSVIAHSFTLALMIAFASTREFRTYRLFRNIWQPSLDSLIELFRLGWPVGMALIAESTFFAASTVMAGWIGTTTLAAHGIVVEIAGFIFMVYLGLANAASARLGMAIGRRDRTEFTEAYRSVLQLTLLVVSITILIFLSIPDVIVAAFLNRETPDSLVVLRIGTGLLFIAALFQLADAMQVVLLGMLRGLGDTRIPMFIAGISYIGVGIPCSYGLGFVAGLGITGIWTGFIVGLGLASSLFWLRLRRRARGLEFVLEA